MKTTQYMAVSINVIIARDGFAEDFLSDMIGRFFCNIAKESWSVIWEVTYIDNYKNS